MKHLLISTFNFSIFTAILVYLTRKPLMDFVAERKVLLARDLDDVRDRLRSAREKFDEYSAKLKAIDAEIAGYQQRTRAEAASTHAKIISEAKQTAGTVISDARTFSSAKMGELKAEISADLGAKVVERAEALLKQRLTKDDRVRLRKEFSSELEVVQ